MASRIQVGQVVKVSEHVSARAFQAGANAGRGGGSTGSGSANGSHIMDSFPPHMEV